MGAGLGMVLGHKLITAPHKYWHEREAFRCMEWKAIGSSARISMAWRQILLWIFEIEVSRRRR